MKGHIKARAAAEGFPGYVRGWCCMAKSGTMQRGYRDVGYLLALQVGAFRPAHIGVRSWRKHVAFLSEHISRGERRAIRVWFKTYYPSLMQLIPERRQSEFIAGVIERTTEENGSPVKVLLRTKR